MLEISIFQYFKIRERTRDVCERAYTVILTELPSEIRFEGIEIATNRAAFENIDKYWDCTTLSYRGYKSSEEKRDPGKLNKLKQSLAAKVRKLEVEEDRVYMRSRSTAGWIRVHRGKITRVQNGGGRNDLYLKLRQYLPDECFNGNNGKK